MGCFVPFCSSHTRSYKTHSRSRRSYFQTHPLATVKSFDNGRGIKDRREQTTQPISSQSSKRSKDDEGFGIAREDGSYMAGGDAYKISDWTSTPLPPSDQPACFHRWLELPQELQNMILKHAFAIPRPNPLLRITIMTLAFFLNLALFTGAAPPSPNLVDPSVVILNIPWQLTQLFVSKKFLHDGLPHMARSTSISFEGCTIDDVAENLHRPSRSLFQRILNGLLHCTPELRITPPTDYYTSPFYLNPAISYFRNLQYVKLYRPKLPPTWIHSPTIPPSTGGDLVQEHELEIWSTRIQMTKGDVFSFVRYLRWPVSREQRFKAYLCDEGTYKYAKRLAEALVEDGYAGRVILSAGFRCEQSDWGGATRGHSDGWERRHGDGDYFIFLYLQFDMRGDDELVRVDAVPTYYNPITKRLIESYRDPVTGEWIEYA